MSSEPGHCQLLCYWRDTTTTCQQFCLSHFCASNSKNVNLVQTRISSQY